jgi:hypothetical protein
MSCLRPRTSLTFKRSLSRPDRWFVPTHKDSPWVHDERAVRAREGSGGVVPPSGVVAAAGSCSIPGRARHAGRFLRSPRVRGFAWGVFLALVVLEYVRSMV